MHPKMRTQSPSICMHVKNITTQFGSHVIHNGVSFDVHTQEILGIVGASGSGKSVLLSYMMGLNIPHKGSIAYVPPYSILSIGVLFQRGALLSSISVLENIMMPLLKIARVEEDIARHLAYEKLSLVGLSPDDGAKQPAELSGGMVKRVALARALILDPAIVFLDEPTAGLDPLSADAFDTLVVQLKQELALTIVMVTHDLDTLSKVCDRFGILVDQKIQMFDAAHLKDADHPWIRSYFFQGRGARLFEAH